MYDNNMINALAGTLRDVVSRSGSRGLRLNFGWLQSALDDDPSLTRRVLESAGFRPPASEVWTTGRGELALGRITYPECLSDKITDILDAFDD